ncbi:hypothetical protein GXM_07194 [Nostoc sphaeroides CCNUC1]|uniref:Uncharacterized protein n=2 Tax=Nostoc sphaeroides TaxID=446679 RepID=A0A5P8WAJ2_9NOSO|nr:hypothetical protein GXM_07194 [Nostoc sphaeroides CCNUC1]
MHVPKRQPPTVESLRSPFTLLSRNSIMTYTTHTHQAIRVFSVDEQSAAQAELNHLLATQAQGLAPNQDPLTNSDRRIIGEIIQVEPESVRTIWIEGGITVWVQFIDGGRLPFDRNWFATRVAQVKATLTQTPQAIKAEKVPPAAPKKLTTVVCSFYDYEFYAASKLLASITHDDELTQPWVVVVNSLEKFRANTWT